MKLQEKFAELESTAFGPWLTAFKNLFSPEELNSDIEEIQNEAGNKYAPLKKCCDRNALVKSQVDKLKNDIEKYQLDIIKVKNELLNSSYLEDVTKTLEMFSSNLSEENKQIEELIEKKLLYLVITSNDVIETDKVHKIKDSSHREKIEKNGGKVVSFFRRESYDMTELPEIKPVSNMFDKYKTDLELVFLQIGMMQYENFKEFILNLPKNHIEYSDYFLSEEKKDGYSKIKAFKNATNKDQLVEMCRSYKNYTKIKENIQELETYLNSAYEHTVLSGLEANYSSDNI